MTNESTVQTAVRGSCRHNRDRSALNSACVYCTVTDMKASAEWLKALEALRPAPSHTAHLEDVLQGGRIPLVGFMLKIGRSESNHIIIKDEAISRTHAVITCEDDKYFIADLGSTNGTLLNGSPVRQRQRVFGGDVIRLGNTQLKFVINNNNVIPISHAYAHVS